MGSSRQGNMVKTHALQHVHLAGAIRRLRGLHQFPRRAVEPAAQYVGRKRALVYPHEAAAQPVRGFQRGSEPQRDQEHRLALAEAQRTMRSSNARGFCVSYPVRCGSRCCRWLTSSTRRWAARGRRHNRYTPSPRNGWSGKRGRPGPHGGACGFVSVPQARAARRKY